MLIAHLPAGYLLGCVINTLQIDESNSKQAVIFAASIGAVLPDVDLLYFYTLGGRRMVHHYYITHTPLFWLTLAIVISLVLLCSARHYLAPLIVGYLGVLLHLLLDTVGGSIRWLYPFQNEPLTFVYIPARYSLWVLNFVTHWTFAIEIILCCLALVIYLKNKQTENSQLQVN
jgi:inner membrane protein